MFIMKKLFIILISIGFALGATAQKGYHRGGYSLGRPRISIGIGGGYGYGYYSPFYRPYSPFYSPYGYNNFSSRPSRLDLEIQDIKLDYADRIKSVKMDDGLKRKEKKQRIRELKYERDKAVIDAKKDYYYQRSQK